MNKYRIIALYGESASGKDTFLQKALEYFKDLHKIVSSTTRPPRDGEKDGIAYHFLTNEEFARQVIDYSMFEAATFRGWYYGTNINDLDKDKINIGVFNTSSLDIILKDERFEVIPVYFKASPKVRLMRALERENNPDVNEIIRRYQTDKKDFEEFFIEHPELPSYEFNNEDEGSMDPTIIIIYLTSLIVNLDLDKND